MPINTTKFIRICALVLAGGFAAQHNRLPIDEDTCTLIFVVAFAGFLLRRLRWLAFFLFGFALFIQSANDVIHARLDPRYSGDSMLAQVRVADFPKRTGSSVTLVLEPINDRRLPLRSRVSWFEPPVMPVLGDIWELELRLRRPRGHSNPGVFRTEDWLFREQLHATGYVVAGSRNRLLAAGSLSSVEEIRLGMVARAQREGGSAAPVIAAIAVGARHLIDAGWWQRFAITGTSHLMAISGLHVGLVAMTTLFCILPLLGLLRVRVNCLDFATIVAVIAATAYAVISGFAVPAQRATIMLGLAACAVLHRRRIDSLRIAVFVALAIFVAQPISSLMPGFILSFAAVFVLLHLGNCYWRTIPGRFIPQLINMQFALLLGLLPFTAILFQRVALLAPVANLVSVPIFSIVTVPATILSMMLEPLSGELGRLLLFLSSISITVVQQIIETLSGLPFADIHLSGVNGVRSPVVLVAILPLLWVVLPRGWPGRWIALVALISICTYKPAPPEYGCFDAHVLDVGQGLAVVVRSKEHTLIFDTGPSYRTGSSAARSVLLPFLKYQGIDAIDWLVVSHADNDHAGGVDELAKNVVIANVLAGESLDIGGIRSGWCTAGQGWTVDGLNFEFWHPGGEVERSGNDSSCVLAVAAGEFRLLLSGDIEARGEQSVLARIREPGADVVVIPHHGSLTSSSPAFVNALDPDIAIVSTGFKNRWGLPSRRVTRRWEGRGADVLDTAESGAISLRVCSSGGVREIRQERERQNRFWRDSIRQ